MPLEGLRAWIGEVERKLGMRTRVFLVLSVIALGGAGAAIYLAIDARESSVSESDVQALQERLEAQIGEGAASTPPVPEEPVEPAPAPAPEPGAQPEEEPRSGSTGTPGSAKLKELTEQAKEQAGK
jgi:hypothetical protein